MQMSLLSNQTNSLDPLAVHSRIFVGNLNTFQCSKSDVERIFQRYGRIAGISMHKGYAFIQFTNPFDARSACEEDGKLVLNQNLDVNLVTEPKVPKIARFVNKLRKRRSAVNKIDTCPSLFGGGSMINSISEADALLMLSPENQIKCTGKRPKHRRQQQPVVSAHHHHPQYYFFQPTSPQGSGTQFNCGTTVTNGGFIYDHQTVVPSNPSPLSPPSLSPSAAAHIPQTLWYANCFLNGQYYGNDYQMLGQNVDDVSRNQHNSAEEEDDMVEEGTAEEVVPGRGEECYGGEAVAEESEKISLFNKHEEPCSEKEFLDELAVHSGEGGQEDVLICGNCKELFRHFKDLIEHRKSYCQLRLTCKCQSRCRRSPGQSSNFPVTQLLCSLCNMQFEDSWDLMQHVQSTHNIQIFVLDYEDGGASDKQTTEATSSSNDDLT